MMEFSKLMEDFSQFLDARFRRPQTSEQAKHNLECTTEALERAVAERDFLLRTHPSAGLALELWQFKQDSAARDWVAHEAAQANRLVAVVHKQVMTLCKRLRVEPDDAFDAIESDMQDYALFSEGKTYDDIG